VNPPHHVPHSCCTRRSTPATALPAPTRPTGLHHKQPPPENRLHESIGYVTPNDEHEGRGDTIRQARRDGLTAADQARRTAHRAERTGGLPS